MRGLGQPAGLAPRDSNLPSCCWTPNTKGQVLKLPSHCGVLPPSSARAGSPCLLWGSSTSSPKAPSPPPSGQVVIAPCTCPGQATVPTALMPFE